MTNEEQTFQDIKVHLSTLKFTQLSDVALVITKLQQLYTVDPVTTMLAVSWFGACLAADKDPLKEGL